MDTTQILTKLHSIYSVDLDGPVIIPTVTAGNRSRNAASTEFVSREIDNRASRGSIGEHIVVMVNNALREISALLLDDSIGIDKFTLELRVLLESLQDQIDAIDLSGYWSKSELVPFSRQDIIDIVSSIPGLVIGTPPPTFDVLINSIGGNASGYNVQPEIAVKGDLVVVDAGTNLGFNFTGWSSVPAVAFADVLDRTTTFVMPDENVSVTANWQIVPMFGITVNRNGGTVNGSSIPSTAAAGAIVNISAGSNPGWAFDGWTSSPAVVFVNASATSTSFPMIGQAVTVTANWLRIWDVAVVQIGGHTSGMATPSGGVQGTMITINAHVAQNPGRTFSHWSSVAGLANVTFANPNSPVTTFLMPNASTTVTANWITIGPTFPPNVGQNLDPSFIDSWIFDSSDWVITTNQSLMNNIWSLAVNGSYIGPMFHEDLIFDIPIDGIPHERQTQAGYLVYVTATLEPPGTIRIQGMNLDGLDWGNTGIRLVS